MARSLKPIQSDGHLSFMALAMHEAEQALKEDEVPIGAVLVKDGEVLARGHNLTRTARDPLAHAEMIAIQEAARKLGNERLPETVLYVTLEPCAMCAGAIIQARIPLVVFGARDLKAGACGTVLRVIPNKKLNHQPVLVKGVMGQKAVELLQGFFRRKR